MKTAAKISKDVSEVLVILKYGLQDLHDVLTKMDYGDLELGDGLLESYDIITFLRGNIEYIQKLVK